MLRLRRGQDFQEQVTLRDPHSDATLRVDFVLRLGETRVAIDVKRSLAGSDDDLEQRGRKAKAQLDDLGTRRYGELLRSPGGFTLAFFPEEGIFDALAAVKGFDFHRFCAERRLWVTTPASLGAVIGLLRELDQERRREAEVAEQMLMLRELDGALCALRDQFLKLGRQLAGSVKAYNEILAMWGSRGPESAASSGSCGSSCASRPSTSPPN